MVSGGVSQLGRVSSFVVGVSSSSGSFVFSDLRNAVSSQRRECIVCLEHARRNIFRLRINADQRSQPCDCLFTIDEKTSVGIERREWRGRKDVILHAKLNPFLHNVVELHSQFDALSALGSLQRPKFLECDSRLYQRNNSEES